METPTLTPSQANNSGYKTIDKLTKIPVVNSAILNAGDYYFKAKDKNLVLRTSLNLAELSLRTVAYAATPITSLCKKPIESVDTFLCDKVDLLESNYPVITKPTEQLTATAYTHAKSVYDKTLKQPIDTITQIKDASVKTVTDIKDYGTGKVTQTLDTIKSYGYEQLSKSATTGYALVNACLEQGYVKMLTRPLLDMTERSVEYLLPEKNQATQNGNLNHDINEPTTLKRLYDINSRVANHFLQSSLDSLVVLTVQFDGIVKRLEHLRNVTDNYYQNSKTLLSTSYETNKNSLKALCNQYITENNISLARLDSLVRSYYGFILNDVNNILHRYLDVLKNLPIVCNGTKLTQTTSELLNRLNKEPLTNVLKAAVEQLSVIRDSLASFVVQLFQSVNKTEILQAKNKTAKTE
jgi:hypothetical protein